MTAYIGLEGTETRGNETNGKITNMALRRLYPFVISYANNCIFNQRKLSPKDVFLDAVVSI